MIAPLKPALGPILQRVYDLMCEILENALCFDYDSNDPIRSQICGCPGSSAVRSCGLISSLLFNHERLDCFRDRDYEAINPLWNGSLANSMSFIDLLFRTLLSVFLLAAPCCSERSGRPRLALPINRQAPVDRFGFRSGGPCHKDKNVTLQLVFLLQKPVMWSRIGFAESIESLEQ